jgi:hypothetical protein
MNTYSSYHLGRLGAEMLGRSELSGKKDKLILVLADLLDRYEGS